MTALATQSVAASPGAFSRSAAAILQSLAVLLCVGTVLLNAIVIRRWSASVEARLYRMDTVLDAAEGRNRKKSSE